MSSRWRLLPRYRPMARIGGTARLGSRRPLTPAQQSPNRSRKGPGPRGCRLVSSFPTRATPLMPAGIGAPDGSIFTPAVIGAPAGAVFTPAWAGETDTPDRSLSNGTKILVWAGLVLGGGILLPGLFGFATTLGQPASVERTDSLVVAAVLVVFGGAIFAPCLATILGFGPVVGASLYSLGIAGCLVVFGMVLNSALAVAVPLG